jgi:hypothetical protein
VGGLPSPPPPPQPANKANKASAAREKTEATDFAVPLFLPGGVFMFTALVLRVRMGIFVLFLIRLLHVNYL